LFFDQACFTDKSPDWLRTLVSRRVESVSPTVIRDYWATLWDHRPIAYQPESDDYLYRRSCPVLVVHTDTKAARYEEKTFRHSASRAVVLAGGGHWIQVERSQEVSAATHDWWWNAVVG
jgi:pimeloyl-ACP methyl ester carboxylesterase